MATCPALRTRTGSFVSNWRSTRFVISCNSTFLYKGKTIDPRQVARELGVRYALEGSVQRSPDKIRINAQLIDAVTNGHVWAEGFGGSPRDVFALQDEVTRGLADALAIKADTAPAPRGHPARLREGATQADLARTYGVSQATISRLEPRPFEVANVVGGGISTHSSTSTTPKRSSCHSTAKRSAN